MPNSDPDYLELYEICPNLPCGKGTGYCTSYGKDDSKGKTFYDWEDEIGTPALKKAGYKVFTPWKNGEGDSFGPLTRVVRVEKDGIKKFVVYG